MLLAYDSNFSANIMIFDPKLSNYTARALRLWTIL